MKKIIGIILIVVGIISTSIGGVTLFNVKSKKAIEDKVKEKMKNAN